MQAPFKEATFALDDKLSSLRLYDCLIPNLTTSKMYKYLIQTDKKIKHNMDVPENEQIQILKEELARVKSEKKKIKNENQMLSEKIYVQNTKLDVIEWYIDFMEDGQDTIELAELYAQLKKDNNNLQ